MTRKQKVFYFKLFASISIVFAVVGIILMFGSDGVFGYFHNYINDNLQLTLVLISLCLFIIFLGITISFLLRIGGTVEITGSLGRLAIIAEEPPKIVNPTLSTTVQCPFECCCEKHHGKLHEGIDIAPKTPGITGDPVFAVTKGKVFTDTEEGIVRLECKMFTIIYRHLATITCEDGAKVKIGDTIGTMGGSDTEEGIHLHIEFWNNRYNYFVDPLLYFDWGNKPGEMEKENINA